MMLRMTISLRIDQGNLGLFSLGDQATIERLEHRVVPGRSTQARHVEQIADLAASTPDLALAPPFAAIIIVRRDAEQGGDGLVAHLTQFRHGCDEAGRRRAGKPPARSR